MSELNKSYVKQTVNLYIHAFYQQKTKVGEHQCFSEDKKEYRDRRSAYDGYFLNDAADNDRYDQQEQ